jgi:transaldolase/glucose-6-phosphate isomerase
MAVLINPQSFSLPDDLANAGRAVIADWSNHNKIKRLWDADPSLWTNAGEQNWLGWLTVVEEQQKNIRRFTNFAEEVRDAKFTHALLLGMGGSSLCPEVLRKSFGTIEGFPELHVLDSTDPAQIKSFERKVDLARTLFFISSKSGTTLEPNILKDYFFEKTKEVVGGDQVGNQFIAITDPGSKLRQVAERDRFRKIFLGVPSIGGRYSALSDFGLAPAAAMGVKVPLFLDRAYNMVAACGPDSSPDDNPGFLMGVILGTAHNAGRNKVTIVSSPAIHDLGAWLEQLFAESTGKNGKGLIPVDREPLDSPDVYGADRIFVYLRFEPQPDVTQDEAMVKIRRAGHPVVNISVADVYNLGQEFFRCEIATAVAGSIIGIDPFDQPDVEASKIATRKLTDEYEHQGSLPREVAFFEDREVQLFADEANAAALRAGGAAASLQSYLKAHLDRLQPNDYFAMLAYLEMTDSHEQTLQRARRAVRDRKRVATCLGFGPRFLHSTGQAYKGGPNTGVFLQITGDDAEDLPVPHQEYTFGIVKAAQARGDLEVLAARGRRALRIHLRTDVNEGLRMLEAALKRALEIPL